ELLAVERRVLGPEHSKVLMELNNLGNAYCGERRFEEADQVFRETLAIESRVRGPRTLVAHMTRYNLASNASAAGQKEKALAYLRGAVDSGMPHAIAEYMSRDPELKLLRGDPEFEALASRARQAASSR